MNTKNEEEMIGVIQKYGSLLYRRGYVILGNKQDVQDVLQEVFIKYMEKSPIFADDQHQQAWLLKVTANLCKDFLRFHKRHSYMDMKQLENVCGISEHTEVLKEVVSLPVKFKTVLMLHYLDGYQVKEIAQIIGISESAVKKRLQRGRDVLRQRLEE